MILRIKVILTNSRSNVKAGMHKTFTGLWHKGKIVL
jgi:hypothetical protein